jgi:hypothetical protein
MTAFTFINSILLATTIVWVVWPLLRETTATAAKDRRQRRVLAVALSILMPVLFLVVYFALDKTDLGSAPRPATAPASAEQSAKFERGAGAGSADFRSVRVAVSIAPRFRKPITAARRQPTAGAVRGSFGSSDVTSARSK